MNNGFTLNQDENGKYYVTAPTGHIERLSSPHEETAKRHLESIKERGFLWTEMTYYTACVEQSKIKINKETKKAKNTHATLSANQYATEAEARAAINEVLPKAKEKFLACQKALRDLSFNMNFAQGHSYEGDTYGIYNEHDYISFDMDGFYFSFINQD